MSQSVGTLRQQVTGDLYAEVQTFYAQQMRRVDALDIEGFADTFTDDGEVVHAGGQRQSGRVEMIAGMRANLPRYKDIAVRHWFGHLLIEADPRTGTPSGSLTTRWSPRPTARGRSPSSRRSPSTTCSCAATAGC